MADPTLEQWRALYSTALEFRRQAPWQWLSNERLFAIENPAGGEVGYCSVMGMGGQEFGLAMFIGPEGFEAYRKLMTDQVEPETLEASAGSRHLVVTFVDREFLERRDLAVIRSLALHFRGRGAWPWFRSQQRGYLPWYLDPEEAVFLTHALGQAIEVARLVETDSIELPSGPDDGLIPTRCYRDGAWTEEWREPTRAAALAKHEPPDEVRLHRLRRDKPRGADVWLLDFFLIPAGVGAADERPYYPCVMLVADPQGIILTMEVLHALASPAERQNALITVLEQGAQLPHEILVPRDEVGSLVAPVARHLGVPVKRGGTSVLRTLKRDFIADLTM